MVGKKIIGSGSYGQVIAAESDSNSNDIYAFKVIKLKSDQIG